MPDPVYVLGHSPDELARLSRQHRLVGGFTRRLFEQAGLGRCRRVLDVGGGETIGDWLDALADLAHSLEGAMRRYGVVSAEELDLPNLAAGMRTDVLTSGAMVFGRSEVGAWCRLPEEA